MLKKIVYLGAALLVILVAALLIALVRIDSVARNAIEIAGTHATGVQTTLKDINIGLFSGEVDMTELQMGNPPGYDAPHFMRLNQGSVAVSLGSLMEETVVVPKLHLDGIDLHLEKKDGKANYEVILENMKTEESSAPPPEQKQGKKFVIQEVLITNVVVHAALLPAGGKLTKIDVEVPEIRLQNVGSDSDNGVLLKDLSGVIIKAVLLAVAKKGAGILPDAIVGGLDSGLAGLQQLGDVGLQVAGQAVDTAAAAVKEVGKVGGEVIKGAGDAGKDVVDGAGKVLKDVGGIFKKKE